MLLLDAGENLALTAITAGTYVLLGLFASPKRGGDSKPAHVITYFLVQFLLGTISFGLGGAGTGGTLLLLLLTAQAAQVLPLSWTVAIALPMPLLHLGMDREGFIRSAAGLTAATAFVVLFARAERNEKRSRGEAERLAEELRAANAKLSAQASQAEALATVRERNRLAREIHDGLGHYLTAMHVQARAARAVIRTDLARAEAAVASIEGLATQALADVRHSVGALSGPELERPLPALLDDIARSASASGLHTTLRVQGEVRSAPPQVAHALLRTVQEGLTNARKHGGARAVQVLVTFGAEAVRVEVTNQQDQPPSPGAGGGGFGLHGLKERARQLGGLMEAGPVPGGFRLVMELPT
ncbi:MAG TPA: histidine kinase [Deinococcales bacterium]|nr:histidine kinase [Deinococcales bacterium]